jgi:hypothetical protein
LAGIFGMVGMAPMAGNAEVTPTYLSCAFQRGFVLQFRLPRARAPLQCRAAE